MGCCDDRKKRHCHGLPDKFVDVSCMKTKEWDEVPTVIGLSECGHVVPIDKPIYELSEDDRNKLDTINIDGKGEKALYSDGVYKKTYTKEKTDEIVSELNEAIDANKEAIEANKEGIDANREAIGANTEAITENAKAIAENREAIESDKEAIEANAEAIGKLREDSENAVSDLRHEVADNYLALAGNTEQTPITGDVYIAERIMARQRGEEGTQYRVMLDGTEAGKEHFGSAFAHTNIKSSERPTVNAKEDIAYLSDIGTVVGDVAELQEDITVLEERMDQAEEDIQANAQFIEELDQATEVAFGKVNDSLESLDARVSTNEVTIARNANDIDQLREDLTNQEKFRGYFETTVEITTIPDPTNGDYAWNAESGTVWLYNGETWYDSTVKIPDQTVEAYEATPRMDGEGSAGVTNRYARGDHQHPSDDSKANVSDLADYLALEGNTQATRMSGDIWMSTGKSLKLSNSGKSYLVQDEGANATQLHGNDVGGVDIIAPNGTVKANGDRVITETEYNDSLVDIHELQLEVAENASSIAGLGERLVGAESGIESNEAVIAELQEATESSFEAVSQSLDSLDGRITENSKSIASNSSDITALRDDLASRELFRGYYETIAEVTVIKNPVEGNYAWCAESGTVWLYNGETWYDAGIKIPDQTVEAYEATPRMDGEGDAGATNRYARGDHQHPSDDSKANLSDLADYLSLEGNTQATRMTGDIWMASGQKVRLNNSGNSYVGQGDNNNTELVSTGPGGIDLNAPNGTVKVNGEEVVTYDSDHNLVAHNNIILANDKKVVGTGADGVQHNLIEKNRLGFIDAGSTEVPFNISSSVRPTVKMEGEFGAEVHDVAFMEDIAAAQANLQDQVSANASDIDSLKTNVASNTSDIETLESEVGENTSDISGLRTEVQAHASDIDGLKSTVAQHVIDIQANKDTVSIHTSDIESIQAELANQEHFRGYYASTAEVTTIHDPKMGDYAYNAESGTKWAYNGETWYDTLNIIPDQTVEAYEGLPLVDDVANAGSINQYARGDHRHPTDTTRASAVDLAATNLSLSELESSVLGYHASNDADISDIKSRVAVSESNITSMTDRVSANETNIHTLTGDIAANTSGVSSLTGRVLANEGKITDLIGGVSVNAADISNLKNRVDGHDSDISALQSQNSQLSNDFNLIERDFTDLEGKVELNKSDISSLQSLVTNQEHFRGYYLTTVEITLLPATEGDYAWNAETGTVWVYNGTVLSWTDSGEPLPVQAVFASDVLPLMDGEADAGESGSYSRGDHRHPTDLTRAAVTDIPTDVSELVNDAGYITATALDDYLPLEGGTMRGNISLGTNSLIFASSDINKLSYSPETGVLFTSNAVNGINITNTNTTGDINLTITGSGKVNYNGSEITTADDLENYLPLEGGTVTGSLMVNESLNWKAKLLTTSDNIDELTLGGNYRFGSNANIPGSYPDDSALNLTNSSTTILSLPYSVNSLSGYQMLFNNGQVWYRRLSVNGTKYDWVRFASQQYVANNYLPLKGGTVTGDLKVDGQLFYHGIQLSESTNIDELTTPGEYYINGDVVGEGTFPANRDSRYTTVIKVIQINSKGEVRQIMWNRNRSWTRTISVSLLQEWQEYANVSDLENYLPLSGGTMTGKITMGGEKIVLGSTPQSSYLALDSNVVRLNSTDTVGVNIEASSQYGDINLKTVDGKGYYNGKELAVKEDIAEIALSDQVLSIDEAGLKANLSVEVNGNLIKILGKEDSNGEKVVIKEINILQSQVIQNVELKENILYVTFIIADESETGGVKYETVEIDLKQYIDVYYSGDYVTVGNDNKINLNYDEVHDELINDGFLRKSNVVNNLASTSSDLPLSANQGKVLDEKFEGYLTKSGGTMTGAITMNAGVPLKLESGTGTHIVYDDSTLQINSSGANGIALTSTNTAANTNITLNTNANSKALYNGHEILTTKTRSIYPLEVDLIKLNSLTDASTEEDLRAVFGIEDDVMIYAYFQNLSNELINGEKQLVLFDKKESTLSGQIAANLITIITGLPYERRFVLNFLPFEKSKQDSLKAGRTIIIRTYGYSHPTEAQTLIGVVVNDMDLKDYLPLSGGTVDGDLAINNGSNFYLNGKSGSQRVYFTPSDGLVVTSGDASAGLNLTTETTGAINLKPSVNSDINLNTTGSGIGRYNGSEIATIADIPSAQFTDAEATTLKSVLAEDRGIVNGFSTVTASDTFEIDYHLQDVVSSSQNTLAIPSVTSTSAGLVPSSWYTSLNKVVTDNSNYIINGINSVEVLIDSSEEIHIGGSRSSIVTLGNSTGTTLTVDSTDMSMTASGDITIYGTKLTLNGSGNGATVIGNTKGDVTINADTFTLTTASASGINLGDSSSTFNLLSTEINFTNLPETTANDFRSDGWVVMQSPTKQVYKMSKTEFNTWLSMS